MACLTVAGVICPQFGDKDSANRRQNTICKDKNCKLQPYLTFFVEMQPILSKDNLLFSPPLTDVSNYLDAIV